MYDTLKLRISLLANCFSILFINACILYGLIAISKIYALKARFITMNQYLLLWVSKIQSGNIWVVFPLAMYFFLYGVSLKEGRSENFLAGFWDFLCS